MEFSFEVKSVLTLAHTPGDKTSTHVSTQFALYPSENLDQDKYLTDGLPTKEGSEVITTVLVQGLVGNIHNAHQNGFKDKQEHFRFIIAELEKGMAATANVTEGEFSNTPPKMRLNKGDTVTLHNAERLLQIFESRGFFRLEERKRIAESLGGKTGKVWSIEDRYAYDYFLFTVNENDMVYSIPYESVIKIA